MQAQLPLPNPDSGNLRCWCLMSLNLSRQEPFVPKQMLGFTPSYLEVAQPHCYVCCQGNTNLQGSNCLLARPGQVWKHQEAQQRTLKLEPGACACWWLLLQQYSGPPTVCKRPLKHIFPGYMRKNAWKARSGLKQSAVGTTHLLARTEELFQVWYSCDGLFLTCFYNRTAGFIGLWAKTSGHYQPWTWVQCAVLCPPVCALSSISQQSLTFKDSVPGGGECACTPGPAGPTTQPAYPGSLELAPELVPCVFASPLSPSLPLWGLFSLHSWGTF